MPTSQDQSPPRSKAISRLIAAAQVVLALALLAVATLPLSAPAVSPEPARAESTLATGEFEEEGEFEDEEEEEEWELEEEGEEDDLVTGAVVYLPPECLLRTAEPSVVAQLAHDSLRLTVRYTADEPTKVGIDYWLKGGKGSLQLGSMTRHLAKQGTVQATAHLDDREMEKVRAARAFMVRLDVPAATSRCDRYLTLRLNAKRLRGNRGTWSERPESQR